MNQTLQGRYGADEIRATERGEDIRTCFEKRAFERPRFKWEDNIKLVWNKNNVTIYKVVQIWPGQTVTCLHTNRPGHIWTTLYTEIAWFGIGSSDCSELSGWNGRSVKLVNVEPVEVDALTHLRRFHSNVWTALPDAESSMAVAVRRFPAHSS